MLWALLGPAAHLLTGCAPTPLPVRWAQGGCWRVRSGPDGVAGCSWLALQGQTRWT